MTQNRYKPSSVDAGIQVNDDVDPRDENLGRNQDND